MLEWARTVTDETGPVVRNGRVLRAEGRKAVVEVSGISLEARVAFSCIVLPAEGDLVLCARDESGGLVILGIIDRPGSQAMTLGFPADATLLADQGSLCLAAGRSVTVAAGDRLTCLAERTVHRSREAAVEYGQVTARGKELQASFRTVRLVCGMVTTLARHVMQKMRTYIRHAEDLDQARAGQMTRKADGLYSLGSEYTVMVSRKDTKIDGERIHMA